MNTLHTLTTKVLLFTFLLFLSCNKESNLELYETWVMCVHWTHFQEENFETPAISFKLQVPNSFEIINKSFVLLDTINKTYYRLKTLKLIEKDTINSLGLSLDSKYMQQYFKTEINVTDNCFTSDLKALSKRSNILLITQGDTSIIPRTLNHNFYEGQKVKFQQ